MNVYAGKEDSGACKNLKAKVIKKLSEPLKGKGHFDNRKEFPPELRKLSQERDEFRSKVCNNVQVIGPKFSKFLLQSY